MAHDDKVHDINTPDPEKHMDKPKGQMTIREAAAMEMPQQHIETGMRGTPVHGFGNGTETEKRHTGISDRTGMDMDMPMSMSAGESVTQIVDHIFQLPFHAQLGVLRMIGPRILGAMDARDQQSFLRDLNMELSKHGMGEEATDMHLADEQDIQGT